MNQGFMRFVHIYASRVSNTWAEVQKKLRDPNNPYSKNLLQEIGESDIAYALLLFVIKKDVWTENKSIRAAQKSKAPQQEEGEPTPTEKSSANKKRKRAYPKRGRGANKSTEDQEPDDEGEENSEDVGVNKRIRRGPMSGRKGWTVGNRSKDRLDEFAQIARWFYLTVKCALKKIDKEEWASVWGEYYDAHVRAGVYARTQSHTKAKNTWEDVDDDGIFSMGSDESDPSDGESESEDENEGITGV